MLLIEGLRSLQRPTYLQTPIGGHHHQLRSLDLVGQLTKGAHTVHSNMHTVHHTFETLHTYHTQLAGRLQEGRGGQGSCANTET